MQAYFIGVDGGATATRATVIDRSEREISKGEAGGANASVLGLERAVDNVSEAVAKAADSRFSKLQAACLAIAGINTRGEKDQWERAIKNHRVLAKLLGRNLLIVNDALAALRSGTTEPNAIVVIAGTGSNCWGRNESGREAKSGGVDYILSDEGSAYALGSAVLHAVTCDLDGRGARTLLTKFLFDKYKLRSLGELVILVYQNHWAKVEIAEVAGLCEIAVQKGDRVAKKIIERTADDLSQMAIAVAKKLGFFEKTFTAVTAGSVFKIREILNVRFEKNLKDFNPQVKIVKPKMSGAKAAALLAFESQKVTIPRKSL